MSERKKCNAGPGADSAPEGVMERISQKAWRDKIPLSGSFAITHQCNFSCGHCYVPASERRGMRDGKREVQTSEVRRIIEECAAEGCLYLLITGGEPLLREDFAEIWIHAKRQGLLLTLFTNGALISRQTIELLSEWPPQVGEITLYGATERTYEVVTGRPCSCKSVRRGIEMLLEAGIAVRLKSLVSSLNCRELRDMEGIAEELGLKFRMDACICPALDGDMRPLAYRLPAGQAVEAEFSNKARAADWVRFFEGQKDLSAVLPENRLYDCGAGVMSFHVDAYGMLQPCLMVRTVRANLAKMSFGDGWRRIAAAMEGKLVPSEWPCGGCECRDICGHCPGFFEMENGSETDPCAYLCEIGRLRLGHIRDLSGKLDKHGKRDCHERSENFVGAVEASV